MKIYLPNKVKYILDKIYNNGYEAFIVGGCVRDSILNIKADDYDITTSAKPEDIIGIFNKYKIIKNGIKHGTVSIVIDNEIFEITTYRIEGKYENFRRPKCIEYTLNLNDDLKRRDFTINAMAYNDRIGLVDIFNGIDDIKSCIVRTVGNPDERFKEDGLRLIRAVRFSSKLGFKIEENTFKSICKNSKIIREISVERVTDEIEKILLSDYSENIESLCVSGILSHLNIYLDVSKEKISILKFCDRKIEVRIAMIMFLDYIEQDYKIKNENSSIINNLNFSKRIEKEVRILFEILSENITSWDKITLKLRLNKFGSEILRNALQLKIIYIKYYLNDDYRGIEDILNEIYVIEKNKECYQVKDLSINGNSIKLLGYKGKNIGEMLDMLLFEVIKNPSINNKEDLTRLLKIYE